MNVILTGWNESNNTSDGSIINDSLSSIRKTYSSDKIEEIFKEKANKLSPWSEEFLLALDSSGHPKSSGKKVEDLSDADHTHMSSDVFLNSSNFWNVLSEQDINTLQELADFIDDNIKFWASIITGEWQPSNWEWNDGDLYVDTLDWVTYQKTSWSWVEKFTIDLFWIDNNWIQTVTAIGSILLVDETDPANITISTQNVYTMTEVDNNIANAIQTAVTQARNEILNWASSSYDTLIELQNELQSNDADILSIISTQSTKIDKVTSEQWKFAKWLADGNLEAVDISISDVTSLQITLDWKEPSFTKNSAFNKNFGTTAWTVLDGSNDALYAKLASANTFTDKQTINSSWEGIEINTTSQWWGEAVRIWVSGMTTWRWILLTTNDAYSGRLAWIRSDNVSSTWELLYLQQDWAWFNIYAIWGKNYFSGNVWIGTTNPWNKLWILGDVKLTTNLQESLTIQCLDNADNMALAFQQAGTFYWWAILLKQSTTNTGFRDIFLSTWNSWNVDALTKRITILWDGGNVWIGTISPTEKLDVNGSVNISWRLTLNSWLDNTVLDVSSDDSGVNLLFYDNNTVNILAFQRIWNDLWILPFGWDVWIGTTTPDALLHIYENTGLSWTTQWVLIEQDWSWDATLQFLRTWIRRWITWIDGSDNKFKISTWSQWLALGNVFTIDTVGNVWIGTISPSYKLEVLSSVNTSIAITNTSTWESRLEMNSSTNTCRIFYRKSDGDFGIFMPLQDWTWTNTLFRIDGNGNTGIWWVGSPAEKLDVNWRIAITQDTAPTVSSWKAVQWVASVSWTKDGTAYEAGDVLWTSNNWGTSKTLIILNHSEI